MPMNQAEELLRVIVRRAIEGESIPVPVIWKERIVELCVRVVHKLIGCDRAVVALCAELVRGQPPTPKDEWPIDADYALGHLAGIAFGQVPADEIGHCVKLIHEALNKGRTA